jgi:release factor glutamine methyltransferase
MNQVTCTIRTLREFIKNELTYLYPEKEIVSLTDLLFENILNIPKHEIHLEQQKVIRRNKSQRIIETVNELKIFKPIQYILGYTDFSGIRMKVTPDVMIPRPETEELVNWIINENPSGKPVILDIGTGSGCIAIALKTHMPAANVFASDSSMAALKVAQKNAESLKKNITFIHQDILNKEKGKRKKEKGKRKKEKGKRKKEKGEKKKEKGKSSPCEMQSNFAGKIISQDNKEKGEKKEFSGNGSGSSDIIMQMYDIIVSNPPYIPEKEKTFMNKNVTDWEPHEALFVPDRDHLLFYRNIAAFGSQHLKQSGKLYLEIHEKYGLEVKELLEDFGYIKIVIREDINGKDRMIRCVR